jgi:hypothetical protein
MARRRYAYNSNAGDTLSGRATAQQDLEHRMVEEIDANSGIHGEPKERTECAARSVVAEFRDEKRQREEPGQGKQQADVPINDEGVATTAGAGDIECDFNTGQSGDAQLLAIHLATLKKKPRTNGVLISSNDTGLSSANAQHEADFSVRPMGQSRKCGTCASIRALTTCGRFKTATPQSVFASTAWVSCIEMVAETLAVRFLPQLPGCQQLSAIISRKSQQHHKTAGIYCHSVA